MQWWKKQSHSSVLSSSVSAEQQLQSFLRHLLPAAGESERASHSATEPPVWNVEPAAQEHVWLHQPGGERHSSRRVWAVSQVMLEG